MPHSVDGLVVYHSKHQRLWVMGCLHDPANVQQMYSKYTRELLHVCWIV